MFNLLHKYSHALTKEEVTKFADFACNFIYVKMNAQKTDVASVRSYYNAKFHSCIVKLLINHDFQVDLENNFIYFLVNLNDSNVTQYGSRFESGISDSGKEIKWINKGELLVFQEEREISKLLYKRLVK